MHVDGLKHIYDQVGKKRNAREDGTVVRFQIVHAQAVSVKFVPAIPR
jgi:hypothetical protein